MKKIITAFFAFSVVLAPAALSAQETVTYQRLSKMYDPDLSFDQYEYTYSSETAEGRLVSVLYTGDSGLRYDYTYNDKGQCVEETWNQNYEWRGTYYLTSRTEYVYDEEGRLATRAIYNNPDILNPMARPQLMGIYYYTYNGDGQLTDMDFYIGETKDVPYTLYHYEYNDRGQLADEYYTGYDFSNNVSGKEHKTYTYDAEGRIAEIFNQASASVEDVDNLVARSYTIYDYAEDGNIIERYQTGPDKVTKTARTLYMVNEDVPATNVIYPVIENADPVYEEEHYNMLVSELIGMDEYKRDNDGNLYLRNSWQYDYDEITGTPGAISGVTVGSMTLRGAAVNGDELHLYGVESVANLIITDVNGRIVKTVIGAGNTVNVSDLAKGVYVVATNAGAAKFVR